MLAVVSCANAPSPQPPLFDCQGDADRYVLRSQMDGTLVLEIVPSAKQKTRASTWLHAWTDIRSGYVVGQQGGHQSHIRLTNGGTHYLLLEGEDGLLADRPGRTYAGVVIIADADPASETQVASCAADDTNRALLDNIRRAREAAKAPPLAEEDGDSQFDGWF